MKDLFGSTKFIKYQILESILNNIENIKIIFNEYNNYYELNDLLSNIDSYLYALIILPNDNNKLKDWIETYLNYLLIPSIEKDSLYIVKSRLINEIFKIKNNKSKINPEINDIYLKLKNNIYKKEEELQRIINETNEKVLKIEYIKNYYNIYRNNLFIKSIYMTNKEINNELKEIFDFLK